MKKILVKNLSRSQIQAIFNEVEAMKKCEHDFIIRVLDCSEHDKYVCIVMPYASGGDL